jgi:hypothetical protein
MFNSVADVLAKAGLTARQIDVLGERCTSFRPVLFAAPSLSLLSRQV